MPAEKQGLVLGLVKVSTIETDPAVLFKKLGEDDLLALHSDQEYEFNLSSTELQLRKVTYLAGTFEQISKEIIWSSQDFNDLIKLLYQYNLERDFQQLLNDCFCIIKNPRSSARIKGIFSSMISVKSGEVGTPKGNNKIAALNKVNEILL
jgi:hypothetical protein